MFSDNASLHENECLKLFQTVSFYIVAHKLYFKVCYINIVASDILQYVISDNNISNIIFMSYIIMCNINIIISHITIEQFAFSCYPTVELVRE